MINIGNNDIERKKEYIINKINEEKIRIIRLQFTDIFGAHKNVAITSSQLKNALSNECMFDGSSIEGFVRIEESDMYLHPDLDTFMIYTFDKEFGKTARFICDICKPDHQPFLGDPRQILRLQIERAKKMGFEFLVGPECEFFMFETDEENNPTTKTVDQGGYFELGPSDKGERARHAMCLALEDMGFEIEAAHHECAPGQHEIDFKYGEALTSADNIMTLKLAVKSIASQHGLLATFMPKPLNGKAGSGMHINMSLRRNGENSFYDKNDKNGLSKIAYNFIAGIMDHAKGMAAITNPTVNSYKRLVAGFEAPIYIAWSAKNRSPLLRIPVANAERARIELRNPDPSANPYLVLAVCLAAGLDGIERNLTPVDPVDSNIFNLSYDQVEAMGIQSIPENLYSAIREMKKDNLMFKTLGEHVFSKYVQYKETEWQSYKDIVTSWELKQYLGRY